MSTALSRFASAASLVVLLVGCALGDGNGDGGRDGHGSGGQNCTLTLCGAACTDTMSDPLNCATCGHACPASTNGVPICIAGICSTRCYPGYSDCNGGTDGCETDLRSPLACGHCEAQCGTGNLCLAADLTNAVCATTCVAGTTRCADSCVAFQTDAQNCGGCGTTCTAGPLQLPVCQSGHCATMCAPGRGDCDHLAPNGCEVDTMTDPANCGGCGMACGDSQCCNAGVCAACAIVGSRACVGTKPTA